MTPKPAPKTPVEIWHNPKCTKSRQTLALLKEHGVEPHVRLYLDDPPSKTRIAEVVKLLGLEPRNLLRRGEAPYKELRLDDLKKSDAEIVAAMAAHPILIERPIVIAGRKAALGRPPEKVLALIE